VNRSVLAWLCALCAPVFASGQTANTAMPHLEKHGTATQLVVDGKPFLMFAAELHNSSGSSLDYMRPVWPRLASIPLNTVLTPVYWELIEPTEGKFNFTLVDGLIHQARENNLHIVFLWFGSWKNGLSSYPPVWVKEDTKRFPRVIESDGNEAEILSTFGTNTMHADAHAFAALMHHIREVDGHDHTVLMMQVENEVGVLGDSRDRSPAANQAFNGPVPAQVFSYIGQHRDSLFPQFKKIWDAGGDKTSGTWSEVFGSGSDADEMFMAWNYGRYVNQVAAAGKAEYPIPMYVNTWLRGPNVAPGKFPSGGAQPEAIDMWRAAGNAIDIYSPDIYAINFEDWCNWYNQAGNPLFIPETAGGARGEANVFYAIGEHSAMGFSPFGIDSWRDKDNLLGKSYKILMQMMPAILQHEGDGAMTGFVLDKQHPTVSATINGYHLDISLDRIFGGQADHGYGLVVATGPNEFLGAGSAFRVKFSAESPRPSHAGIGYIEEGEYANGTWIPGRRLNGDESDQGQYWRFSPQQTGIERAVVYRYQ
jgi:beta-galactosidase GanA